MTLSSYFRFKMGQGGKIEIKLTKIKGLQIPIDITKGAEPELRVLNLTEDPIGKEVKIK
jgi:hypothetical protein